MSCRLYVAAKAPRPGLVKTRLGRAIGQEQAAQLYRAFLQDLSRRLAGGPFPLGWYVTPDDAWPEIAPMAGRCRGDWVLPQGEGDWAGRQQRLFEGAAARGEAAVVLIASDSPQVTIAAISDAFRALDAGSDLVLGPVLDGGYWLIGSRTTSRLKRACPPAALLNNLTMSTAWVVDELRERALRAGLSVALLQPTFDVDEVGDLAQLASLAARRDDLSATRAALSALGLLDRPPRPPVQPRDVACVAAPFGERR